MRNLLMRGSAAAAALMLAVGAIGAAQALDRSRTLDYGAPGWVLPGAALDFNFAADQLWQKGGGMRSAAAALAVSRSSSGTAQDTAGNVTTFGSNVARITNAGLLIEEARTNSQPYNMMAGASFPNNFPTGWHLDFAGGLVVGISGTGTENGIPYIDLAIAGTTGGASSVLLSFIAPATSVAAANGQIWASSFYWRVSGGSLTNISSANLVTEMFNSGGSFLGQLSNSVALPSTSTLGLGRVSSVQTLNNASTAYVGHYLAINWTGASLAINATMRIGGVQLEQGASATSLIFTNGAAVSRSADFITVKNPPMFGPPGNGLTAYVLPTPYSPPTYPTTQTPLQIDDGTNNNRLDIDMGANARSVAGAVSTVAGGAQGAPGFSTSWPQSAQWPVAWGIEAMDQGLAANGMFSSYSGTTNFGFTPSRIVIGSNGNGQHQMNGLLARLAIWPTRRLPDSQLLQLAP